jgi:hypothetical protein
MGCQAAAEPETILIKLMTLLAAALQLCHFCPQ